MCVRVCVCFFAVAMCNFILNERLFNLVPLNSEIDEFKLKTICSNLIAMFIFGIFISLPLSIRKTVGRFSRPVFIAYSIHI